MRSALALLFPMLLAGCIDIPAPNLSFAIDCPVPQGSDFFPASGEVSCHATGPWTRAGDVDWDFGDGSRAEGDRVAHQYDGPGSYALAATLGPQTRSGRIGIPAELTLEGDAPLGGVAGQAPRDAASVNFEVLEDSMRPSIVVDSPQGPTRLGVALIAPDGTQLGGCSCTTPAEYPLTEALAPGTYELRVWIDVGPGVSPATSAPFEARVFVPYISSFLGPFRLD